MKIFVFRQSFFSFLLLFVFISFHSKPGLSQAQQVLPGHKDSLPEVIINTISIDGNKITRSSIIYRELVFHEHDTIPLERLPDLLKTSRENIFNTALFNIVTIDTILVGTSHVGTSHVMSLRQHIDIRIHVIERWYIWPWPWFVISDRNFNSWLETTDWSKVTYGVNLTFFNMRGRNETLVIPLHFGFNQLYGLSYKVPYINKGKTIGTGFGGSYGRNHQVVVQSLDNQPVYYQDFTNYPEQTGNVFIELFLRPDIYTRHTFHMEYNSIYFSDSLIKMPGFSYNTHTNGFYFFSLLYQYKNDHRDIQFYPLHGYYFDVNICQNGFFSKDVDLLLIKSSLRKYWQLQDRWYFATGIQVKFSLPGDQPYFLQRGLGYGRDYVRGYEYYVIDGQQFFILKNNIKFAIIPQHVAVTDILRSIKFNTIPYALFVNAYADFGYVYNESKPQNEQNDLQNLFLAGGGIGLDFTTYYDIVIRLECSVNREGIPGLYLHFIAPI
jgi:outer membrane protein assembly factor BamA